jgi:hypothetical protein
LNFRRRVEKLKDSGGRKFVRRADGLQKVSVEEFQKFYETLGLILLSARFL